MLLPSDSSMDVNPGNKISDYTVHFNKEFEMGQRPWEMALVSLVYPTRWIISKGDSVFHVSCDQVQADQLNPQMSTQQCIQTFVPEYHISGKQMMRQFDTLMWLPMQTGTRQLTDINIQVLNMLGDIAHFIGGKVVVKLAIRPLY